MLRMTSPARMPASSAGPPSRTDLTSPSSPSDTPRKAVRARPSSDELRKDAADRGGGDGEADAGRAALRVHADHAALGVDERPARVAGVDGGVGLDRVGDGEAGEPADLAAGGRDDPRRGAALQAVRGADGEDGLADPIEPRGASSSGLSSPTRRGAIFSTARSVLGSRPTIFARDARPQRAEADGGRPRPSTTCAFVTRWPSSSTRNAAPVATRRPLSNGGSSAARRASTRATTPSTRS